MPYNVDKVKLNSRNIRICKLFSCYFESFASFPSEILSVGRTWNLRACCFYCRMLVKDRSWTGVVQNFRTAFQVCFCSFLIRRLCIGIRLV